MKGALTGERYRVIVSSDIGGTDPDDSQSMVHYLLYSDVFDTEGFISSPMGKGRVDHFLEVIDEYEKDYHKLCRYAAYPAPDHLRSMVKQGAIDPAPDKGYTQPTEGSEWIIQCAKKEDPRPLYVLVWGLIEDVAQALHDAPEIASKLRVHFIGGFNKMCGLNAYEYICRNFPDLWMIEDNSTYRGWFVGGDQSGDWGNHSFTMRYAVGHGALGQYFAKLYEGTIKMGDTPTVSWLLGNDPAKPEELGWAGRFVKVNDMPCVPLQDTVEVFQVTELELDGPVVDWPEEKPAFYLQGIDVPMPGYYLGDGKYRIRLMVREPRKVSYYIVSEIKELNGLTGQFTVIEEQMATRVNAVPRLTQWWSDILDPQYAEGIHKGAKLVNQYRQEFLGSFAERFGRLL